MRAHTHTHTYSHAQTLRLVFSSLGDSVNNLNLNCTESGIFAHVVTASHETFDRVCDALVDSGIPKTAINLQSIPTDLGFWDMIFGRWTVRTSTFTPKHITRVPRPLGYGSVGWSATLTKILSVES